MAEDVTRYSKYEFKLEKCYKLMELMFLACNLKHLMLFCCAILQTNFR
jgi:hypothetical protein